MNPRLPLAVAIVGVLAAGVALVLLRPGDLATEERSLAQVPAPTTTTTTRATGTTPPPSTTSPSALAPGAVPEATPSTTPAPTTPPGRTTPAPTTAPAPTTEPAPSTTVPGDPSGDRPQPPRLAYTGESSLRVPLGLVLLAAAGAARWAASKRSPLRP